MERGREFQRMRTIVEERRSSEEVTFVVVSADDYGNVWVEIKDGYKMQAKGDGYLGNVKNK